MKESLSEQEEVSTRRSRRARKRVQDSNFVFIWFWIPDLWIYLLARHVQGTFDEHKHESQMFSLSIVYWFFYYLRSDSQQTTKKARYDAICVQECPNFNIWGYGLRSKRFEGSRLYSKIISRAPSNEAMWFRVPRKKIWGVPGLWWFAGSSFLSCLFLSFQSEQFLNRFIIGLCHDLIISCNSWFCMSLDMICI